MGFVFIVLLLIFHLLYLFCFNFLLGYELHFGSSVSSTATEGMLLTLFQKQNCVTFAKNYGWAQVTAKKTLLLAQIQP